MNDRETKIQELKDKLEAFRDARDWKQFHTAKDLAEAIVIEAGELLEHFLWKTAKDVEQELEDDEALRKEVRGELADIITFCFHFANAAGIDIADALVEKIEEGDKKYPIDKAKGNATKYTKL